MPAIHVKDGTHAGWRRTKPQPKAWDCPCGEHQRAHRTKCHDCGASRPA